MKLIARLQITVFPYYGADFSLPPRYYWALMVGLKEGVENGIGNEERVMPLNATNMLFVRAMIGKVTNMERLAKAVRSVPELCGVGQASIGNASG